jgi:NodT family efflux transporter outer membrane factor (OMF) lipoprotein
MNISSKKIGGAILPLLAGLLCVGGCMTVGPDYRRPETKTPAAWSADLNDGLTATQPAAETLSRWWTRLDDPVLSDLMEQARTNNLDIRQAEARLREARAQRGVAKADLFPTVEASGSASRNRSSEMNGESTTSDLFKNGLDASWELDLFGKKRRALEAADATLQASQEDLSDVMVSLFAEVALSYIDVREYQLRLSLTESNIAARVETYDITRWRREAGLTTQLDVEQARLSLEQARADVPALKTSLEEAKHRLAVLLGQTPGALKEVLAEPRPIPVPPVEMAVGVPADVLRQRPDVRRAERKLAAQTAQIGVAKASRYPSFSLLGSIGLESLTWGDLYSSGARTAQGAVNAAWTLFDFGRIRRNIEVQTALQEEALSLYESTILTALEDVENALVAYANEQTRRKSLAEAAQAGQTGFELARDQYSSGLVDFQTVLDMQRSLLTVQDQLAASDGKVTADLIRLYKALGGGWTSLSSNTVTTTSNPSGEKP